METMSVRVKISVLLLMLGSFLAFIPGPDPGRFTVTPQEMALWAESDTSAVSPDEVARWINSEDATITLIDLRSREEYENSRLPGALHLPLAELTDAGNRDLLSRKEGRNIFYSNGDEVSAAAVTLSAGMGYQKCYHMKGGMNGWVDTVMNSTFGGERISARENALFTQRFSARKLFQQYNSLPDSLRESLFETRRVEKARLDGGCE